MINLSGDVALQTADDLELREDPPWCGAQHRPGFGSAVPEADDSDHVKSRIRLAITAPMEPMAHGLAGGCRNRVRAAQVGECGIRVEPLDVLPGRDEQLTGVPDPNPEQRDRLRCRPPDKPGEVLVELADLTIERDDATGDRTKSKFGGLHPRSSGGVPAGCIWREGGLCLQFACTSEP